MKPSDLVSRFLGSVGRPTEANYYLSLFRGERRESFATIWVEPAAVVYAAGALAVDLEFLSELGLSPVFAFSEASEATYILDRLPGTLGVEITLPEHAVETARAGRIPLVPIKPSALSDLVSSLGSKKTVFLGVRSGLLRADGTVPSLVDLTTEYDELHDNGGLAPEQAELLERAKKLIDDTGGHTHVAVTSPFDLLRELFTVRGAGTLIRRGARIQTRDQYLATDKAALLEVMTSAFGRVPRDAFFDRAILRLYVADEFRGAAVLSPSPLAPYLSKFVVDARAQGEGIGRDLWRALSKDFPSFFWRARRHNPIIRWYEQHCDGMVRTPSWQVFWRGLAPDRIPDAIAYAEAHPPDFAPL